MAHCGWTYPKRILEQEGVLAPLKNRITINSEYTDSRVYIHPPWKIEEVGVLFDQIGEGLLAEFNRINVKLSEKSGPDVENNLSSSIYGSLDGNNPPLVESRELLTKIVNELKEEFVDIGSVTPTENKLWNEIQARFTIVGGRIRLLLSDSTCARDLLSEVDRAVECISFEELDKISALDYTSIRSILYSLMPKEGAISGYDIKITLKYIQSQYQSRLHRGVYNDMNSLFKAFFSQKQDGGTAGIIFEKSALKLLSSSGKPISCRHLKSGSEFSIKLERLEVQYFSENENIMDVSKPTLLIPRTRYKQVDAIILTGNELWLVQLTVSAYHSFIPTHIDKVVKQMPQRFADSWKFAFCVPQDQFINHKPQHSSGVDKKVLTKPKLDDKQYVWCLLLSEVM